MADLRWWRVEFEPSGRVVSCRPVERPQEGGRFVVYVEADDALQADRLTANQRAARALAARRREYRAKGLCDCGRKREDAGFHDCRRCRERHKLHTERQAAKRRGEKVEPLDRRVVLRERKEAEAGELRLQVLLEVQSAWEDAATNGAFTKWLTAQIDAAGGKRRAG